MLGEIFENAIVFLCDNDIKMHRYQYIIISIVKTCQTKILFCPILTCPIRIHKYSGRTQLCLAFSIHLQAYTSYSWNMLDTMESAIAIVRYSSTQSIFRTCRSFICILFNSIACSTRIYYGFSQSSIP